MKIYKIILKAIKYITIILNVLKELINNLDNNVKKLKK